MFDLIKEKFNTLNNNVKIKDGIISYNEIKDNQNITFIVISADKKTLIKSIEAIANVHKQYKDRNLNVVVSSSYEKLHKLSNGVF